MGTCSFQPLLNVPISCACVSLLDDSLTVPMLVDLVKKHEPSVQAACLGVIQNLSSNKEFHRQLLERGVLEALDASKDVEGGALGVQCATVLYNFSHHEQSLAHVTELGGIFLVTHLSYSHIIKVKRLSSSSLICRVESFFVFNGYNVRIRVLGWVTRTTNVCPDGRDIEACEAVADCYRNALVRPLSYDLTGIRSFRSAQHRQFNLSALLCTYVPRHSDQILRLSKDHALHMRVMPLKPCSLHFPVHHRDICAPTVRQMQPYQRTANTLLRNRDELHLQQYVRTKFNDPIVR